MNYRIVRPTSIPEKLKDIHQKGYTTTVAVLTTPQSHCQYVMRIIRDRINQEDMAEQTGNIYQNYINIGDIIDNVNKLDEANVTTLKSHLEDKIGKNDLIDIMLDECSTGELDEAITDHAYDTLETVKLNDLTKQCLQEYLDGSRAKNVSGVAISRDELSTTNIVYSLKKFENDVVIMSCNKNDNGIAHKGVLYHSGGDVNRFIIMNRRYYCFKSEHIAKEFMSELDYGGTGYVTINSHNQAAHQAMASSSNRPYGLAISTRTKPLTDNHIAYINIAKLVYLTDNETSRNTVFNAYRKLEQLTDKYGLDKPLITVESGRWDGMNRSLYERCVDAPSGTFADTWGMRQSFTTFKKVEMVEEIENIVDREDSRCLTSTVSFFIPIRADNDMYEVGKLINRAKLTKQIDTDNLHITLFPYVEGSDVTDAVVELIDNLY